MLRFTRRETWGIIHFWLISENCKCHSSFSLFLVGKLKCSLQFWVFLFRSQICSFLYSKDTVSKTTKLHHLHTAAVCEVAWVVIYLHSSINHWCVPTISLIIQWFWNSNADGSINWNGWTEFLYNLNYSCVVYDIWPEAVGKYLMCGNTNYQPLFRFIKKKWGKKKQAALMPHLSASCWHRLCIVFNSCKLATGSRVWSPGTHCCRANMQGHLSSLYAEVTSR